MPEFPQFPSFLYIFFTFAVRGKLGVRIYCPDSKRRVRNNLGADPVRSRRLHALGRGVRLHGRHEVPYRLAPPVGDEPLRRLLDSSSSTTSSTKLHAAFAVNGLMIQSATEYRLIFAVQSGSEINRSHQPRKFPWSSACLAKKLADKLHSD